MSHNGFSIDGALMGEMSLWFVHNPQLNYLWVSKWMMHLWMDDFMIHPQPTAELLWVFKWMVRTYG
jgi:hypothetical protein